MPKLIASRIQRRIAYLRRRKQELLDGVPLLPEHLRRDVEGDEKKKRLQTGMRLTKLMEKSVDSLAGKL